MTLLLQWEMEESARRTGKADDRLGGSETNPKDKFANPLWGAPRLHGSGALLGNEPSAHSRDDPACSAKFNGC